MEERIKTRIAELEQAEREAEMRLVVIRNLVAELRGLLQSEMTITHGEEPAIAAPAAEQ